MHNSTLTKQEIFMRSFLLPLADRYGKAKFNDEKTTQLWSRMKTWPNEVYRECANDVLRNYPSVFPGVELILKTSQEVFRNSVQAKASTGASSACDSCNNGLRQASNYTYRCPCSLGSLNYPSYPLYQGQADFKEQSYFDDDGERVYETATHIMKRGSFVLKVIPGRK